MSLNGLIVVGGVAGMATITLLVLLLHGLFVHLGAKFVKADYSDHEKSVAAAAASMLLAGVFSFVLMGAGKGGH